MSESVYGDFPLKLCNGISHFIGAKKFYPAAKFYFDINRNKYKDVYNNNNFGGFCELNEDGLIKYYYPIENQECFNLSRFETPEMI